ncbi:hypothetical protein ElyMa_005561600 [Elysia marginata]|uniref:Uncharacterized protein n=1 Tax=Elysia marginata TaxID=1093978 RepID=A0AAV4EZN5_9GAST|nr:hypothetical protein ElyMa_005561600 [Elysia marginata]
MTSVSSASAVTNYVDQYGSAHVPTGRHTYSRNKNSRTGAHDGNVNPASQFSATSAASFKGGSTPVNDTSYTSTSCINHHRISRHSANTETGKSMKDMSGEAEDTRRRGSETGEHRSYERVQDNENLSYTSRRRSNQEPRRPRDGSVSGRRSRNASPSGDDRISTVSSSRRRSSVSRNPERENRRHSKNLDPDEDDIPGQGLPHRNYDSNNSDLHRHVRPSKPYDPGFKDPPGQIRPSRRYDSTGQRQDKSRDTRHYEVAYDTTDQNHRSSRNEYNNFKRDHAEKVRSSRQPEPHQDPPGHIRRSSMHFNSESGSQGQMRASIREKQESEAPSRRYSMSRSDSTGADSRDGGRYQHRKSRGHGDRETEQANSSGVAYRDVRRSQSRHSDMRRSISRSSSVEKSSDVEMEFRSRDRSIATARARDKRNDEDANLVEQKRKNSKARVYDSQDNSVSGGLDSDERKRINIEENCKHATGERDYDRDTVRSSRHDGQRQRRRSSSVANDDPEYESADSRRQSASAGRGYRYHGKARYNAEEDHVQGVDHKVMNPTRRRNSRSSRADIDDGTQINATDSRYDLDLSQDSSYSLVSQVSRQYHQPQPSRSTSRHEMRTEDDSNFCPTDRAQVPGHRRVHGRSSNHRKSMCSREEGEGTAPVAGTSMRPEGQHSRRSSSSKSNQDTGFASSPSTPRREDSQSRFSSDASPSRYGINDDGKHHRLENGRRRRRGNLVTNKSLDVPGVPLRKEQSLSSSGRGDSSFEEPVSEQHTEGRKMRHAAGTRHEDNIDSSISLKSGEDINRNIDTIDDSDITTEVQNLDNLASKETAVSSSATSCSSTTLNKESCESAKALSSSTSTLKGATYTSKTSIAGSISSLFGRNNNDGQPAQSVSDRWRKLKQDMMPENNSKSFTDSGKEKAAAIFSAAAAKFMSSFPGVSAAFPNMPVPKADPDRDGQKLLSDTEPADLHVKENGFVAQTLSSSEKNSTENPDKGKSVSPASSQTKLTIASKPGDTVASLQTPTVASSSTHTKPGLNSSRMSTTSLSNVSTSGKTPTVSPAIGRRTTPSSQRPSIVSTELSSHERRANVYAAMTERGQSDCSDSEDSGEMV